MARLWEQHPRHGWYLQLCQKSKTVRLLNILKVKSDLVDSWDRMPGLTGGPSFKLTITAWDYCKEDTETYETWAGEQFLYHPVSPVPEEHEDYDAEEDDDDDC